MGVCKTFLKKCLYMETKILSPRVFDIGVGAEECLWGAVLRIIRYLRAFLASTHWMPVQIQSEQIKHCQIPYSATQGGGGKQLLCNCIGHMLCLSECVFMCVPACMCMNACLYVCVYVCTCIHVWCVYMFVSVCLYVGMYMWCTWACLCLCMYVCMCIFMCTHVYLCGVCICMYVPFCVHRYRVCV